LDVAVLPTGLDHAARFVRVFPWRWSAKKGWVSGIQPLVNQEWEYDYDNVATSSLDVEYVPMRHDANWDAYANINGKQKSTHVLAFNEPDQTNQANMTVAAAIANWPNLVKSGLRLGAPAVSDSGVSGEGLDWLYSFMTQATSLNYRVDFVPVHWYKCGQSAQQLTNYLAGVYQRTGRPVWLTEWNNGASWCGGTPPTYQQEATAVAADIAALESAPYVERYSIYTYFTSNWAEVVNGTLTPAGVVYSNQTSAMAYAQALPAGGARGITQLPFSTNTLDSSGYGNDGMAVGLPGYATGPTGPSIVLDGTNSYLQLPPTVASNNALSCAAWVYWNGGANWQRIFDFGSDTAHYLFLTPSSGSSTLRFAIKNNGGEQIVETSRLPIGQWIHLAVTLSGNTVILYTNGMVAASSGSITIAPSSFNHTRNYLGRSQYAADPLFGGQLSQVLITDYALSGAQIASLMTDHPPQFANNFIAGGSATQGQAYASSVAGQATDPDLGDTLTYSKASGPAWLTVNADGSLTGTPTPADGGTNYFTVVATDAAGESAFAVVTIILPPVLVINANGTWSVDASGNWSFSNRWSGNVVANGAGFTADFSTLDISADRTVALDGSRSIGTLKFSDTSGSQNWIVSSISNSVLTLDTGASTTPSIVVSRNTATIAAPVAGGNGFAKTGSGTLILSGINTLSGTVLIDTGTSTATYDGITRAGGPASFVTVTNIQVRDNNSGTSTFQLDGLAGNVAIPARFDVSCRNTSTPIIENLDGTNSLSGFIGLHEGGSLCTMQSDSGLLMFSGTNQYIGSLVGSRTYSFIGAGDHYVGGPIFNSVNGSVISLSKSGAGQLTLNATNTYTGTTTVSGGTLLVNGLIGPGAVTVASTATLGGYGVISAPVTVQAGGTLSPGTTIGTLTINNALNLAGIACFALDVVDGTNDLINGLTTVTYGGTLLLTNLIGTLVGGESFQLFSAAHYSGAFSSVVPLTPGLGLAWNTNNLAVNGTVSVLAIAPPPPPDPPTNLTATASDGQVTLTWTASVGADTYNLKRSTVSGEGYGVIAGGLTATSYTDTNVVDGTTYYYVVSAVDSGGEGTNSTEVSATPLSPFQTWQMSFFGCWDCPQADPAADPDGDGQNNLAEWLSGTDPTSSASAFRILSIVPTGSDFVVTWQGGIGSTSAVQAADDNNAADYTDISDPIVIPGSGVTNFPDAGAATNAGARFYRIRLVP